MVCQPFLIGVVLRFQVTVFVKEFKRKTCTYPKLDFRILKFPNLEFPYLVDFIADITDFVNNL